MESCLFLQSSKNAFQGWVTQVWSRQPIFKKGLEHSKLKKGWTAQITEEKNKLSYGQFF